MSTTIMTPIPLESGFPQVLPSFQQTGGILNRPRPQARTRRNHMLVAWTAAFAAMCLLAVVVFHGYVAWMLAHPYVAPLFSNPKAAVGLDYEDIVFPSKSGRTTVSGWYVPAGSAELSNGSGAETAALTYGAAESKRTVVLSHGYGANREETWVPMYDLTKLLNSLHYNVVLFDYGYASSDYKVPATGGLEESQQLLAAVDYAKAQGAEEVIVWGFSMGAGTALQAALQTDDIDGMILDSLFLASSDTLYSNVTQIVDLPRFPSMTLIESLMPVFSGASLNQIPLDTIMNDSFDIPLYIIHGTNDAKAPYQTAELIAAAQNNPLSRSWIVPQGQHEMLFREDPNEYIQRAVLFLSQLDQKFDSETAVAFAQ
ncbi:alpha/beta hydrolase [Paenibacillus sp. NEAU-GSW1]|uniref:alpha/beta hydrolase n=1 Tax=Paenibacillus sp. NEAU-GSW1 TaxID=2682486 RepID=UPI0012E15264|nr:alpha/beta fold hydrolase [Paenibacillus sp. NEAU-GSW1]MUT65576.1 alpha/beta fold hydrolase [Paenibacillus sp. NEAU-GSW1]